MKPLFTQGPYPFLKITFFTLISVTLMVIDYHWDYLKNLRMHLLTVVYPAQYIVNLPVKTGQWLTMSLRTQQQLLEENNRLHEHNLRLQVALQKLQDLEGENERLRHLLGASIKTGERVRVAEVLAVELDPFRRKIIINKGKKDDVFEGQPLLDAQGVIGQIDNVGEISSTAILITDTTHQLPVQVVRTGLQTVAKGMGSTNRLALLYLPNTGINANIKVGDLLVTSGLGGKFPAGYPVGTVIEVNPDISQPYAQVHANPKALLERNREVLLVWKQNETNPPPPTDQYSQP